MIRNSSSLPTTPTTTPKPQTIIPPLTIKGSEHQSKSSPSAIITLPVGAAQPHQQFFASIGQTQASTLILDTTNSTPLVQIASTAPVTTFSTNSNVKCVRHLDSKEVPAVSTTASVNSLANVERGCQASISDDELTCDNMKTTSTQVWDNLFSYLFCFLTQRHTFNTNIFLKKSGKTLFLSLFSSDSKS